MSSPTKSRVEGRKSYQKSLDQKSRSTIPQSKTDRANVFSSDEEDDADEIFYSSSQGESIARLIVERSPSPNPLRSSHDVDTNLLNRNPREGHNVSSSQGSSANRLSRQRSPVLKRRNKEITCESITIREKSLLHETVFNPGYATKSLKPVERHCSKQQLGIRIALVLFLIPILIIGVTKTLPIGHIKLRKNCTSMDSLKYIFPHQDPYLWRSLKSGVESVLNGEPPKPSIFLFLHRDDISSRSIVNEIADNAATCFDPKLKAVTLDSEDFKSEDVLKDVGIVIERFRETLKTGGVAFIADLNRIPSETARALHFICDGENPIVQNVVIFLTLKASSTVGKPVEIAEDTLNAIWRRTIDENTLSAIVARVTDQVLTLNPE